MSGIERRQFKRVFFSEQDGAYAIFSFLGNQELHIRTLILNVSETGLGLMLNTASGIRSGDVLMLREVIAPQLQFLRKIKAQVRWVLQHDFLSHTAFGCEFVDLEPEVQERLCRFMLGADAVKLND